MACKYRFYGEMLTEEELRTKIDELSQRTELDYDMPELYHMATENDSLEPSFVKTMNYRMNLITKSQRRLALIKDAKKQNADNEAVFRALSRLEKDTEARLQGDPDLGIVGLNQQLEDMQSNPSLEVFLGHASNDFDHLTSLVSSNDFDKLNQARTIIRFYKQMNVFDPKQKHPLYDLETIIDENGDNILPEDIVDILGKLSELAAKYETIIERKERSKINESFEQNRKLKKVWDTEGQITYDKIFSTEKGIKDASVFDMFVLDITNGVFSQNGVAPQVMLNELQNVFQEKLVYAKDVERRLDELKPRVEKAIASLDDGKYVTKFPGFKSISYDIFRSRDRNGMLKDHTVQRYSDTFEQGRNSMLNNFYSKWNKGMAEKNPYLQAKEQRGAFASRDGWMRKATHVLDVRRLQEVQDAHPEFSSHFLPDNGHTQFLKDTLGEIGYQEEVAKQLHMLKEYITQRNIYFDEINGETNEAYLKSLYEQRNDPFIAVGRHEAFAKQELVNRIVAPATDTPLIDFSQGERNKKVFIDPGSQNLGIDLAKLTNAQEGDRVTFLNTNPLGKLQFHSFEEPYRLDLVYTSGQWVMSLDSKMSFNYSIPKREGYNYVMQDGAVELVRTSDDSGYYDAQFARIEENPDLKEFHTLLTEVQDRLQRIFPPEVRERLNKSTLPALRKSISEILMDDNLSVLQKISRAVVELYDRIRAMFGVNLQNSVSYATTDPITGIPDYQVNDQFVQGNKEEIASRYFLAKEEMKIALGIPIDTPLGIDAIYDFNTLPLRAKEILAENLGVPISKIAQRLPSENLSRLPLMRVIKEGITNHIVAEKSYDLPKMLKLFSYLGMQYQARQEILPYMEMVKRHYEQIKAPKTTALGKIIENANPDGTTSTQFDGFRDNANRQMESWFERAVLGNYGSKSELGDTRIKRPVTLNLSVADRIEILQGRLRTTINGKILSREDKILRAKLKELLLEYQNSIDTVNITDAQKEELQKRLTRIEEQIERLGKDFSIVSALDAMFNYIRLMGLGWNVSSYLTNYMEGQIANTIVAASGDYFPEQSLYEANQIVMGSFIKNWSGGYIVTPGAKKASVFMLRFNVLQDASNELQKASAKSAYSNLKNLSPYEGTRRTEYLNQSPLMIALLKNTSITGIDGTVSNVWNATNEDGTLIANFRTEENINNWENGNGKEYLDFSSSLTKIIVNTHGDYDELRGNLATEYSSGKALMMFRRWMGRQFYQRFAMVPQTDIEVGIKDYRGRYLSHTTASGLIHGAIVGFGGMALVGSGPLGLIAGGTAGLLLGKFFGANSSMSFGMELVTVMKQMLLNYLRIPLNSITGKPIIKSANIDAMLGTEFTQRDLNNMRANFVDLSMTLAWTAMILFTKALLWDDDDEDEKKRAMHNFFANRFIQLSSQAAMYVNPIETYEGTFGSMAAVRFLTNVGKTFDKAKNALEGDDLLAAGPNAGESALALQAKKTFLPMFLRDPYLGLGAPTERQFAPTGFDKWFWEEGKKEHRRVQALRARYKKQLIEAGIEDPKVIRKALDKKLPYAKKKKEKK